MPAIVGILGAPNVRESQSLCNSLLVDVTDLLSAINELIKTFHTSEELKAIDAESMKHLENEDLAFQVIESPHPYTNGVNSLRQSLDFPGADAVAICFDSRCSTMNPTDCVRLRDAGPNGLIRHTFGGSERQGNWYEQHFDVMALLTLVIKMLFLKI